MEQVYCLESLKRKGFFSKKWEHADRLLADGKVGDIMKDVNHIIVEDTKESKETFARLRNKWGTHQRTAATYRSANGIEPALQAILQADIDASKANPRYRNGHLMRRYSHTLVIRDKVGKDGKYVYGYKFDEFGETHYAKVWNWFFHESPDRAV